MAIHLLPAEALYVDGIPIEKQVRGYRTLGVSGRELLPNELNIVERINNDGSIVLSEKYPSRIITVDYLIRAEDNREFRHVFNHLNKILRGGEKEFKFHDDMGYAYYGYLQNVDEVPNGVNTIRSSFHLFCPMPFKYGHESILEGTEVVLAVNSPYKSLPSSIEVTMGSNSTTLNIVMGEKKITLTQLSLMAGDRVTFDFDGMTVTHGGNSLLNKMSIVSDFEDFYIQSGEPIKTLELSTIKVKYREVLL